MKSYEQLQSENDNLRRHLNQLYRENQELTKQVQYTIPKPFDVGYPAWEVPLVVGYPSLNAQEYFTDGTPCGPTNHYTLRFKRVWSNEGWFWRVEPFASLPEKAP